MIKWILTYSFVFCAILVSGQTENFAKGNELYEAGDYQKAIESYGSVIAQGYHSTELYYNLGNAHYRNGEIGKAIWAYESALKIDPDHKDALHNLEFVNAQTVEKLDTSRHGFGHWLQGLVFSANVNFWTWLSIVLSVLFSVMAILFIRSQKRSVRNISMISAAIFAFGLVVSLVIGKNHETHLTTRDNGVVIVEQVKVLVSPLEDADVSYKLGEGAKVNLVSEEKDWVQIDLNGNKGWVQKKNIWEI